MTLVLHPRAAPPGTVRVWLGIENQTSAPSITWRLNGALHDPVALRPLQSARPSAFLSGTPPRVFTGVYEFQGLAPGALHKVFASAAGHAQEINVRTLPASVGGDADGWFNILLVSCFYRDEAPRGVLEGTLYEITREHPPHLSVLLGDQVYLDLPTLDDFPSSTSWLAEKFERDYRRNWFGSDGYAALLAAAPSVSTPDDHEYWNNFPHASPIIGNTYKAQGRAQWTAAAAALFEAFQLPVPGALGDAFVLDVPPVSMFVADSRSHRASDRSRCLKAGVLNQLRAWVDRLKASRSLGIFVTGQSLFDPAASTLSGAVGDRTLANYADFPELVRILADAPQLLAITGDVHWGRVVRVLDAEREFAPALHEIITSPSSLVASVGIDHWKRAVGWVRGFKGGDDGWPRHSDAADAAPFFGADALGRRRFSTEVRHRQKGDQLAVLSLRRHGGGVLARVTYYPLHSSRTVRAEYKAVLDLPIPPL